MKSLARTLVLLLPAALLAGIAARPLRGAEPAGFAEPRAPALPESLEGAPSVPLLRDYRVLAHYRITSAQGHDARADYSGITIRSDRTGVQIWICEDKAPSLEHALFFAFIPVPSRPESGLRELQPSPMPILNPAGLRSGEDIEDITWVASGDARVPPALLAVGEQGPKGDPHSWRYRLDMQRDGLALRDARPAPAPPLETTNNDGLEGVAARRLADGRIEVYTFKERSGPIYVMLDTLAANADPVLMPAHWKPPDPRTTPRLFEIPGLSTQSGATFRSSREPELLVIDRLRRRLAVVPLPAVGAPPADRLAARLWYDYTAVDSLLEGRTGDTPASFFGTCEGVAEDSRGHLYLLSDNNEANSSRLVILERRPDQK